MTRQAWKMYYRLYRIQRREHRKAFEDMVLYGIGFVQYSPDIEGFVGHVPALKVMVKECQKS